MGCAVAWYLLSNTWLTEFLQVSETNLPIGGKSLFICIAVAISLISLSFFRTKLDSFALRLAVPIGGLAVSSCLVALAFALGIDGAPVGILRIAWPVASGIVYGLELCAWVQNLADRTVRGAMTSVSIGLLCAGCLIALSSIDLSGATTLLIALPFVSFILFGATTLISPQQPSTESKRPAQASGRSRHVPYAAIYAALMGFATTQFFALNGVNAPTATVVCMVAASGLVFLFVSQFLIRALGITWCLFLVGMLFGIVIAFWIVLPEASALVVVTTATLHWASLLLVASAAFEPNRSRRFGTTPTACALLALFYAAAELGNIATYLGTTSRVIICIGAFIVLSLTFLLARRENALDTHIPPSFEEDTNRIDALQAFARAKGLTPRETEVFLLIAEGNTLKYIADKLVLSENTVKRHRTNVYQKLGVNSRQELIDKTRGADSGM